MFRRCLLLMLVALAAVPAARAQDKVKRKMTVQDLLAPKRVSDPVISPDGQWVAYTLGTVDLAKNKVHSSIWLAPTSAGKPKPLFKEGKSAQHARWSPDGKSLLFAAEAEGETQ